MPRDVLVAHTSALTGEPSFVLICDDAALRWLAEAFRGLGGGQSFTVGDGLPIGSDGKCLIDVGLGADGGGAAITAVAAGRFRWILPPAHARRHAELIEAMVDHARACHQYLEADHPGVPAVIVTKGEHGAERLRQMRERHPGR